MSTSEEPLITPEPPRRRLSGICCVTHYEADASLPAISLGVPWSWRPCLSQLHSGILFTCDSVPGAGTLASAAPRCPLPAPLLEPSREQGSERLVFLHLTVWNSLPGSQFCWRFHVPLRASVIPQHWLLQGATELRCSEPGRRPAGNVSVM